MDVRFRGKSGRAADNTRMTESDPGCVKTHTVAKCRNNNSPGRHHASRVQYDLTLRYAIPSRSFYARSEGWSFYTAKTLSGHRPDRNPRSAAVSRRTEVCYHFCRKHGRYRAVKRRALISLLIGGTA